jgi:4'-phosphopantetheinyl transferase
VIPLLRTCQVYIARRWCLESHHVALLDGPEIERRARYRCEADRDRFTLAAVLLRAVVGRAGGADASAVVVDRRCDRCGEPHGRPRLPRAGLEASISHSGDVAVVAITEAGPVGVDVEFIGTRGYAEILRSVCTRSERESVQTPADFFAFWTRKEAVVKATGEGLNRALTDVVVTPPDTAPAVVSFAGATQPECRMSDVLVEGYAGAAAVLTSDPVSFTVVDAAALLSGL